MRTLARAAIAAVMLAALLFAGCAKQGPKFDASDITGASFGRDFALQDPQGRTRTLEDFRGKVVVVFFGYTQCPDVCPATLAALAQAMRELGARADRVQVLFVTVDPDRDTAALLAKFVPAFDPRFLGLRGDDDATAKVAKEFHLFYQKVPGAAPGSYTIDHSAGSYIYDPRGRLRLYVANGQAPEVFAHDIGLLLDAAS